MGQQSVLVCLLREHLNTSGLGPSPACCSSHRCSSHSHASRGKPGAASCSFWGIPFGDEAEKGRRMTTSFDLGCQRDAVQFFRDGRYSARRTGLGTASSTWCCSDFGPSQATLYSRCSSMFTRFCLAVTVGAVLLMDVRISCRRARCLRVLTKFLLFRYSHRMMDGTDQKFERIMHKCSHVETILMLRRAVRSEPAPPGVSLTESVQLRISQCGKLPCSFVINIFWLAEAKCGHNCEEHSWDSDQGWRRAKCDSIPRELLTPLCSFRRLWPRGLELPAPIFGRERGSGGRWAQCMFRACSLVTRVRPEVPGLSAGPPGIHLMFLNVSDFLMCQTRQTGKRQTRQMTLQEFQHTRA